MPTSPPDILVIAGPTASGKSGLAMDLAQTLGGEIIGADSVQVYKHLNIGSAKASPQARAAIPHHLVDALDLDQPFDAGLFATEAARLITDIQRRGALPILCGGTGLYLRTLLYGVVDTPPSDETLRRQLRARIEAEGVQALHAELALVDPVTAQKVHHRDKVRVIRALEVWTLTGTPLSTLHAQHRVKERPCLYRALQIGLSPPREALYDRINKRVEAMFKEGFVQEVQELIDRGVPPTLKPLGTLGYKHLVHWCLHGGDLDQVKHLIQRDHRRYAKRQMTWLRGQAAIQWCKNAKEARALALQTFAPTLTHEPTTGDPP